MSVKIVFFLSCYPCKLVISFSVKMCTLLNMDPDPAHGKVLWINECALYEHAASWLLLFRLTSAPLKCQCSQSHLLTLYSFPVWPRQVLTMLVNLHLFTWTTYLLNSRCTFPCGYLTGIANLCFLKAEPWSCLQNLPSSTCCGSSVREIVQCNSMSCRFFSNHFSPSQSPCPCSCPHCFLPRL